MLRRTSFIFLCLALVLAVCTPAEAQRGKGMMRGGGSDGFFSGCPAGIDLTDEQSVKIQELRSSFFKDTAGLRADIFKKEQELDVLMLEPAIDTEKAKKLQDEISEMFGKMEQKKLESQIEVRKVLTPDQLRQLPPGCGMGIGQGGWGCYGRGMGMGYGRGGGRGPRGQGLDDW